MPAVSLCMNHPLYDRKPNDGAVALFRLGQQQILELIIDGHP
jgi:hypothetical protein